MAGRRTGFTRPLHMQQIVSWLAYLAHIITYFTVLFPTLTRDERIAVTTAFIGLWLFYNIAFLIATSEQHDDVVPSSSDPAGRFFCQWCRKMVKLGSKHCRSCNQCRQDFDHHCFFLNNCVTDSNYKAFFCGVLGLTVSSVFTTLLCIWVIMSMEYDDDRPLYRAREMWGYDVPKGLIDFFCGAIMFMCLAAEVFMIYLVSLHFLLHRRKITTFQLIMWRRQQSLMSVARQ